MKTKEELAKKLAPKIKNEFNLFPNTDVICGDVTTEFVDEYIYL